MKKVNVQYICDCCGEQITDEVKALVVGKINPVDDEFTRLEMDIRHYHDSCLSNILEPKPPTKKKRLTTEG